ncbi:MAG TPA: hypothetical protein VIL35_04300 [Vicinamibacterales bacterium]
MAFPHFRTLLATIVASAAIAGPAFAGPPLICHPFETGGAASLPWGTRTDTWNNPDPSYDVSRLEDDVMRLLAGSPSILARMETVRRATIYAGSDRAVAERLLARMVARARAAETDALALFDAGLLIEAYRQASRPLHHDMLPAGQRAKWTLRDEPAGQEGYTLVKRAIALAGGDAEMEFAASLMTTGDVSRVHHRKAAAGATPGTLLAAALSRN